MGRRPASSDEIFIFFVAVTILFGIFCVVIGGSWIETPGVIITIIVMFKIKKRIG